MKVNRNENESQNGRTIYLYDHAVINEFAEPITFDTVATAYELLEEQIEQCQALRLELLKSKAEVQHWKDQLGKQKQMIRSRSNQGEFAL
jgi:cell shape-determining protein MreC